MIRFRPISGAFSSSEQLDNHPYISYITRRAFEASFFAKNRQFGHSFHFRAEALDLNVRLPYNAVAE
jgi:hypothetical protein